MRPTAKRRCIVPRDSRREKSLSGGVDENRKMKKALHSDDT